MPPLGRSLLHGDPADGELVPGAALRLAVGVAAVEERAIACLLVRLGTGGNLAEVRDIFVHLHDLGRRARLRVARAALPPRGSRTNAIFRPCQVGVTNGVLIHVVHRCFN